MRIAGLDVDGTPPEPEREGFVSLEICNTTPRPAKDCANKGLCWVSERVNSHFELALSQVQKSGDGAPGVCAKTSGQGPRFNSSEAANPARPVTRTAGRDTGTNRALSFPDSREQLKPGRLE